MLRWILTDSTEEDDQEVRVIVNRDRRRRGLPAMTRAEFEEQAGEVAAKGAEEGPGLRARMRTMRWARRGGR